MKQIIFIALVLTIGAFGLQASQIAPAGEMRQHLFQKTTTRLADQPLAEKTERRLVRAEKRLKRVATHRTAGPDFNDPIAKWLWFGLIGLGLALLFSLVSYGLAGLMAFAGIVCLVIWIIKREQAV